MVNIPPIKIVMNGGWFNIAIPTLMSAWNPFDMFYKNTERFLDLMIFLPMETSIDGEKPWLS